MSLFWNIVIAHALDRPLVEELALKCLAAGTFTSGNLPCSSDNLQRVQNTTKTLSTCEMQRVWQ